MAPYDDDFTGEQTSGPGNDPYAGGRGRGPVGGNTSIPPNTGATGSASNQGGNTYQSASRQIQDAYRKYLGRDASPQEISDQLGGGRYFAPENVQHALGVIQNSEEAQEYNTRKSEDNNGNGEDPEKADARDQMQAAYLEHLEREMSDEEFEAWWDGTNEWGPAGIEGLPGWLRGVAHEGNRLKGLNTGSGNTGAPPPRTGQAPGGYDQTKWESEHDSVKYAAGGFLAGLTKPSEIKAMVESAEFQDRFPGATFNGKDKIDFGDNLQDGVPVGVVDVLMRTNQAGDTSGGFWWGAGSGDGTTDNTGDGSEVDPDFQPGPQGDPTNPLSAPNLDAPPNTFGMGPGGGGGMMGPGGGGGTMGNMITPYNPLATYSPEAYVPPDPYRPPAYAAATPYQPGTYDAAVPFSRGEYEAAAPYVPPTAAEAEADPSYQFRLQQGLDALERSGAARGISRTGGTMKGLFDYGANSASQEYASVDARKRDTYDTHERNRFNAYAANYGNAMDAYGMNERNRFGAFGENERNLAGAYNTNEANRAGAFNTNVRNAENAYATNEANRFKGYTTNEGARLMQNQTAENRRAGAYDTNARNFQDAQNFGLRAQNQGWNQGYQKWVQQYNQQRGNRSDNFTMMDRLAGAQ